MIKNQLVNKVESLILIFQNSSDNHSLFGNKNHKYIKFKRDKRKLIWKI